MTKKRLDTARVGHRKSEAAASKRRTSIRPCAFSTLLAATISAYVVSRTNDLLLLRLFWLQTRQLMDLDKVSKPARPFSKAYKLGAKGLQIIVVAKVINDVVTEGVVVAAENAGRDLLWPLPEIGDVAINEVDKVMGPLNDEWYKANENGLTLPEDGPLTPRAAYPWLH